MHANQALKYEWKLCEWILTAGLKSNGPKSKNPGFLFFEWVTFCHCHITKIKQYYAIEKYLQPTFQFQSCVLNLKHLGKFKGSQSAI